jgi:hypothetical protein
MHGPFVQQRRNNEQEIEKTPFLVIQKIRDAIFVGVLVFECAVQYPRKTPYMVKHSGLSLGFPNDKTNINRG